MKNKYVFSCGDINGIGPEIVIKTLNQLSKKKGNQFIFVCPQNVFNEISSFTQPMFQYKVVSKISEIDNTEVILFDIGNFKINTGKPTRTSGKALFLALLKSCEILKNNFAEALITAPISKEAMNKAGYHYPGHTELLAEWFNTENYVMMFLSKKNKAALTTIHKPISAIPKLLTAKRLKAVLDVVISSLQKDFNINSPKIGILGLNPHAGESGLIGSEEEKIIKPFLKGYDKKKFVEGPFSPDAYWGNLTYKNYDLTLGMYHDQVLIPFKLLNFSKGVNYTAGLPIVRTSPDHGVAYDIAGKNIANESSMLEAFHFAEIILNNRKRWNSSN